MGCHYCHNVVVVFFLLYSIILTMPFAVYLEYVHCLQVVLNNE